MKTNKSMSRVERMHREKVTRYSIRKYSFGAASVAVAALFMFLGNGAVSADMTAVQPQDKPELKVKPNDENTGSGKVQGNTTKQVGNTVVAETIAKPEEPATPALDKTKLEKYIKEIEAKLDKGAYANKTEKSVALLKAELAAAKEVLQNATTQAELTKAYSKLVTVANTKLVTKPTEKKVTPEVDTTNGQPTVGKKAKNTEPKAGTNSIENTGSHDPRNGKAIDTNNPLRTGEQPAIEDDPYNSFVFSGNDQDFKKHSNLEWFSKEGDGNNRNNASLTYGEDSHGKYVEWKSTQPRGGGFKLTIDKELGEEYTIGVKFAFDKTTGGWRKIVDYKNSADDTGFYFNKGRLQFYNDISSPLGTNPVPDNTVVDFIIVKSRTEFAVYLVKDGKVTKEMSLTDAGTLSNAKPYTENGKTIFGFFFDDTSTDNEATPGGRVYRMSIYDKAIDPTKVVEKLNKTLDDSKYEPELKNPLPDVKKGSTPNAEDFIKNTPTSDELNKLPANTRITWGEVPDTSSAGLKPAVILVTYPDGSADRVGVKVKVVATATPAAPVVTPNPDTATVTVTPEAGMDEITLTYTPTGTDQPVDVVVKKTATGWTVPSGHDGITVSGDGIITLTHSVAKDGTEVKAKVKKGNSDYSAYGTATDPTKEATPAAPTVTPNQTDASVTVTPEAGMDEITLTYTPTGTDQPVDVVVKKTATGWTVPSGHDGITVSGDGIITLTHSVAKDGTEVKAKVKKGNSDYSAYGTATDPTKEATPAAPTVTPNQTDASVTVTPEAGMDEITLTYTPTGTDQPVDVVVKKTATGWTVPSGHDGITVSGDGIITLTHSVAKDGTEVKAKVKKGNSDYSAYGTATDPVKQATPAAPTGDVDKGKLESAIHRLDDFINHQSDKLDENSAKKAKALLEEGKKVFADSKASQEEVDTMVKRIEDFISEVSPTSNQTNPANNQATQTSAVTPATVDAVSNQATANARQVAKELPNTGTADSTVTMVAATASALLGLGLAGRRRKEDEEA